MMAMRLAMKMEYIEIMVLIWIVRITSMKMAIHKAIMMRCTMMRTGRMMSQKTGNRSQGWVS